MASRCCAKSGARDRNWIELTLRLPTMLLSGDPTLKDRVEKLLQ